MSTMTNAATHNTSPELSEADRAAWLRIEGALRGMRWWMLFLATIAMLVGLLSAITLVLGILEELNRDDTELLILIAKISVLSCGVAFLPLTFFLGRTWFSVGRLYRQRDQRTLQIVLLHHRAVWIAMAACAGAVFCLMLTIAFAVAAIALGL
ncbi:MAG: hypothetical protein K2Y37_22975 [Pirellulales bacterium]|nr:hypothetical protein [Pirellulales bacterium]